VRELEFVIVDDGPVVKTSGATPDQEHRISLYRRFQCHFGEYTAMRTLLREAERNGPIWAHRKPHYRSANGLPRTAPGVVTRRRGRLTSAFGLFVDAVRGRQRHRMVPAADLVGGEQVTGESGAKGQARRGVSRAEE
jgi:hypothetical protein